MGPTKERSRDGCVSCLQKRKKCDEVKPICARCSQGGNRCIWRSSLPKPKSKSRASVISLQQQTQPSPNTTSNLHGTFISAAEPASMLGSSSAQVVQNNNAHRLVLDTEIGTLASLIGSDYTLARALGNTSGSQLMSEPSRLLDTSQSTLPPRSRGNLKVSASVSDRVECATMNRTDNFLDEDEEEVTKALEWIPEALEIFGPCLPCTDEINWLGALNSYFIFITRYVYESSNLLEATKILSANYGWVNSARLGLLGTTVLFHSYTDPLAPQYILREYSRQLIDAATTSIHLETAQSGVVRNIVCFTEGMKYYSGDLGAYVKCVEAAVPMVKALVGPNPVEFHRLSGAETIDIRSFIWCDIFTAIAASRPTRLIYECNPEILLRKNQEGPNPIDMNMDIGLEWMCGLPDAMLMLIIQIINLRHSSLCQRERLVRAARIEKALRDWKVWPSKTTNSVMRVQRMGAQEIWRYFAILYLYQAIHQASPSREVVQQSVSQIFKLGSMLRLGHNPDCLLTVPYFVAGTFAISVRHRQFFRSRLLGCGIEVYGQKLVNALEELWQKSLDTGKHNDWTTKSSPIVIFS